MPTVSDLRVDLTGQERDSWSTLQYQQIDGFGQNEQVEIL